LTDLLERDQELGSIADLLDRLAEGRPRTVLIEGPAGIGKTRLLGELKGGASERGLRVLNARGSELEREFPFGVVRQLFEPALSATGHPQDLFTGAAAGAASVFAPPGSEAMAGDASFPALHGLFWLTLNLAADRPLILAIDDLQWCDRPSLRLLAYLVHRLEGQQLLVAATLRQAEPGADTALLAEIGGDPLTDRILPGALSIDAIAGLIEKRLGAGPDAGFSAACDTATGGNPLLLYELLSGLEAEGVEPQDDQVASVRDLGPGAVSRTVLLRLARLSETDRAVARALAVLGEAAELGEIAALAGVGEAAVARSTAELTRVEILRSPRPLAFVHPVIRDAVYEDLSPALRELEHARGARLLHGRGASAERVAAQVLRAGPLGEEWSVEVLVEAGRAAAEVGGAENAVAYLRRALEEPLDPDRRTRILLDLGRREMDVHGDEAVVHLRAAFDGLADPEERGWAGYALARTLMFTGHEVEAADLARRLRSDLPREAFDLRFALEAVELETFFFGRPGVEELARTIPDRGGVEGDGPGSKVLAAATAYAWANVGGRAEECVALAREALDGETLFDFDDGLFWVPAMLVLIYADSADRSKIWDEARAIAYGRGSLFTVMTVDLWRGFDLLRRGDLEQAEQSIEMALEGMVLWAGSEMSMELEWPACFLAEIRIARGDLDGAEAALARGEGAAEQPGDGPSFWRRAKIELLLARGRDAEALELCETYRRLLGPTSNPAAAPWRTMKAEALDRLGRTDEAIALAAAELEVARGWGAAPAIGHALRVLGTLEHQEGLEHLGEAVTALEDSGARLEHAMALLAFGTATRLSRRPTEAREPLGRALETAAACSADALVKRARAELRAAGVRPRREALGGVASLTPSELRVAGMAAGEMTNREIAQALFVTPKTIEVHLSNAYRKLDIGSRRDLAGVLAAS
jgi:DNA-binding CsgD family transcriptional regulator